MNNCIFCNIVKGEEKSWKVYENENVFAFLDIHPVNKYHTLVIPRVHSENIFDIPEDDLKEVICVVKRIVKIYENKLGIKNVQIINSSGAEAQQDVFHTHFHIVPRIKGDNQNVSWTTHPEWVEEYDQLLKSLD
ncbi:MAG: HIT family protein [Anaerolineaceae bacterium]|nr:HIT family protein [Anaerolineaceae bacterium]